MLVQRRSGDGMVRVGLCESAHPDRVASSADLTRALTLYLDDHLPRGKLRVVEQLVDGVDRRAGNAGIVEAVDPVLHRARLGYRFDRGGHRRAVSATQIVADEARV